jgi:hypothetical protein
LIKSIEYSISKQNSLVVLYPYVFGEFLEDLYQLEIFKKAMEVKVWDLSLLFNAKAAGKLYSKQSPKANVTRIKTTLGFILELLRLRKKYTQDTLIIFDELDGATPKSLFFKLIANLLLSSKRTKFVEFLNPGVPIVQYSQMNHQKRSKSFPLAMRKADITSFKEFTIRISQFTSKKILKIWPSMNRFILIAGSDYEEYFKGELANKRLNLIRGHSHDFSRHLVNRATDSNLENQTAVGKIVYLATSTPTFSGDSSVTGRRSNWTSEKWYPSLRKYFDLLENETGRKVIILGHYKSNFSDYDPIFGNRRVIYGKTIEMIKSCDLVISLGSTATSFAAVFHKPVQFIYSDELEADSATMGNMMEMSRILGMECLNIDIVQNVGQPICQVNYAKYEEFVSRLLSYKAESLTNPEIIMKRFFS